MKYLLLLILLAIGCSSSAGYDSGPIQDTSKYEYDDIEIEKFYKKKPQLKYPFSIGVYVNSDYSGNEFSIADKENLLKIEKDLVEKKIISKIFFIDPSPGFTGGGNQFSTENNPLKRARKMAARYNADTVLMLSRDIKKKSDSNIFSVLYLTIVGMWVVPATEREYKVTYKSALWDARNEFLYATSESEAREKFRKPIAWFDDEDIYSELNLEAIDKLKMEISKRIENLKK